MACPHQGKVRDIRTRLNILNERKHRVYLESATSLSKTLKSYGFEHHNILITDKAVNFNGCHTYRSRQLNKVVNIMGLKFVKQFKDDSGLFCIQYSRPLPSNQETA